MVAGLDVDTIRFPKESNPMVQGNGYVHGVNFANVVLQTSFQKTTEVGLNVPIAACMFSELDKEVSTCRGRRLEGTERKALRNCDWPVPASVASFFA